MINLEVYNDKTIDLKTIRRCKLRNGFNCMYKKIIQYEQRVCDFAYNIRNVYKNVTTYSIIYHC